MKVKCLFQNHKKWYRKIHFLVSLSKEVFWNMEYGEWNMEYGILEYGVKIPL